MSPGIRRASAAGASRAAVVGYDDLPAMPPWRAVLRLPRADLTGPRLVLHMVQTEAAWTRLVEDGVLRADRGLAEPSFAAAYAWMEARMAARGLSGEGMLWLWARISRRGLRHHVTTAPDRVLLTVEVSSDHVLLSHFGDWHCVLNVGPIVSTTEGEPFLELDRRYGAVEAAGRSAVTATCESVFDRAGGVLRTTSRPPSARSGPRTSSGRSDCGRPTGQVFNRTRGRTA